MLAKTYVQLPNDLDEYEGIPLFFTPIKGRKRTLGDLPEYDKILDTPQALIEKNNRLFTMKEIYERRTQR